VPFTHAQHQERIKDCNICHGVFPQETDAIKRMKEAGTEAEKSDESPVHQVPQAGKTGRQTPWAGDLLDLPNQMSRF
jgi:hypothetical protein